MPLFRAVTLVAGAFLLFVHAAGAQNVNPCAVVDSYERALAQQDFTAAYVQLADDAVVTVHDPRARSLTGRTQIQEFLQYAALRGAPVLTSTCQVAGNTVTWSERPDEALHTGDMTVQAAVLNSKIQSLVYRPGRLVQSPGSQTPQATSETAGTNLAALVLLGLGLLSLATAFPHVGSESNLRGRLLRDLRHWRHSARASKSTS